MPEYDFFCAECRRKFTQFIRYEDYGKGKIHCPLCNQSKTRRLINRVRFARSEESRMENLSEFSGMGDLAEMEKDPQALGKMMRRMSSEIGEEMGPEFNEVVDRLEKGQSADEIEHDLPEIGGGLVE
jgi:putative FmdB family regulatory protein